ncbi:MAG TPA: metalloregulator ArsR/SmtB family transcription factor [Devosiaceae bacterium]|jgi:DNA-binding transcriptional ArsR family regulator|nr:metalloregulator ArsR/SmtB family transcription factor [Devosiaceae bacterium]
MPPPPSLDLAFHALADPTRRAVVMRLATGAESVGSLAQSHKMALPSFLKHVGVLEQAGLIATEKVGRVRTCRLNPSALQGLKSWLSEQEAIWESRTDRLQALVENRDQ